MKLKVLTILLLLGLCSCASPTNQKLPVQQALNYLLPPSFRGDIDTGHKNAYFDFQIVATKLRNVEGYWLYETLSYKRNGRFSTGWVTIKGTAE